MDTLLTLLYYYTWMIPLFAYASEHTVVLLLPPPLRHGPFHRAYVLDLYPTQTPIFFAEMKNQPKHTNQCHLFAGWLCPLRVLMKTTFFLFHLPPLFFFS
jgi:hypothetical protein